MSEILYPFSDDFMYFDEELEQYVLTPKYVLNNLNIDMAVRLNTRGAVNKENLPKQILEQISTQIYNVIYKQSNQNEIQSYLMRKCPSARNILQRAMAQQVLYFFVNGDLSQYAGVDIRKGVVMEKFSDRYVSQNAIDILNKPLKETGISLMYEGHYPYIDFKE